MLAIQQLDCGCISCSSDTASDAWPNGSSHTRSCWDNLNAAAWSAVINCCRRACLSHCIAEEPRSLTRLPVPQPPHYNRLYDRVRRHEVQS